MNATNLIAWNNKTLKNINNFFGMINFLYKIHARNKIVG